VSDLACEWSFEFPESSCSCCNPVTGAVGDRGIWDAGMPACPDEANPRACDDAGRVGVAFASLPGVGVKRGCPAWRHSGVVRTKAVIALRLVCWPRIGSRRQWFCLQRRGDLSWPAPATMQSVAMRRSGADDRRGGAARADQSETRCPSTGLHQVTAKGGHCESCGATDFDVGDALYLRFLFLDEDDDAYLVALTCRNRDCAQPRTAIKLRDKDFLDQTESSTSGRGACAAS
jgi:hypothetical protein